MVKYIKHKIQTCMGYVMKTTLTKSNSELLYSFPINSPMKIVCCNVYYPGKVKGFEGLDQGVMILTDIFSGFAAEEPIIESNSEGFAKAVYSILIRYGLASIIVTDPDSKSKKHFKDMCELMKITHHESAKGNHNAILSERINRFINEGLTIFNDERQTTQVFHDWY